MIEIKEKIAHLFKIAREEGAIVKWADGTGDAEEVINLLSAELDKLTVLDDEKTRQVYNSLKMKPPGWIPEIDKALRQAQLDLTVSQLKGLLE